jgi:Gluconate 2-dehydrogenase subunit 3
VKIIENRDRLLRDPKTGEPIPPRIQPGYYPGYSTLSQKGFWDAATREIVLSRLEPPPPIRFFSGEEVRLLECICDHVLPQDDRDPSRRIPIVPLIDERLYEKRIPGFRFASMPPDGEAYQLGLRAINSMAKKLFGHAFLEIRWSEQEKILKSIHDGKPMAAQDMWRRLPPDRYWALLVEDCVDVYYAHPWSWDEIGFGGPAYPRAYMRLERGEAEYWEVEERRYEWSPPIETLSDPDGKGSTK